ncbi:macrophage mannose receptor 1-like [Paramacrobiotus metropolitanus]|uniref:macrophage mannose receptor 1-like n=1 Tax=Paramacrobiotus metropolitanus TaxID=2943436 RepID=UPI00244593DF|nr:macrophage mannose receptor 1-like [Paramacrobiotus metropolitanus]
MTNLFFAFALVLLQAGCGFGQGTVNMTELCGSKVALTNAGGTWYYLDSIKECIFVGILTNTWESAEMECLRKGAHLAVLTPENTPAINALIKNATLGTSEQRYFIGLRIADFSLGEYMWVDFSPLTYSNWAHNEPASIMNHDVDYCVTMSSTTGLWADRECVLSTRYFCQRKAHEEHGPPVIPTRDPQGPRGGCKEGWISFGAHCYYFSPDVARTTWPNALENCRAGRNVMKNSSLVSILNPAENDFLVTQLKGRTVNVWTGLHEVTQNIFEWSDHHRYIYNNWHYQYPRFTSQLECISMLVENNKVGRWTDVSCINSLAYVCKAPRDRDLPDPQPTPSTCAAGYEQYGDGCFKVIALTDGDNTWSHAQELCKTQQPAGDGGLATIIDVYENAFVRLLLDRVTFPHRPQDFNVTYFTTKAWLGMREEYGHFKWLNNCPTHFVNLDSLLGNVHETLCIDMNLDGKWHPHNCSQPDVKFAVCERRLAPCPNKTAEKPEICPDNFPQACSTHCYTSRSLVQHIGQEELATFDEARSKCIALGGDLATIRTEEDQKCIAPYSQYAELGMWIGLQNKAGSTGATNIWHWVDQYDNAEPVTYVNWMTNEPNGWGATCAEMYPNGYWNDESCSARRGYVCQAVRNRTATVTNPTAPPSFQTTPSTYSGDSLGGGQIAGIVIGVLLCVAILGGVAFVVLTGRTKNVMNYFGGSSEQGSVKFTPKRFRNPGEDGAQLSPSRYSSADESSNAEVFPRADVNITQLCGPQLLGGGTWYYLESIRECIYVSSASGWGSTWDNSELECRRQRAHLTVLNNNNQQAIADLLKNVTSEGVGSKDFFIGLRMTNLNNGEYTWLDFTPIIGSGFINWAPNQPLSLTDHSQSYCVVMSGVDGKWSDRACSTTSRYICQRRPHEDHNRPPVRPTRGPGDQNWRHGGCAQGWVSFGPHCYYISPDQQRAKWSQALTNCMNGHDMKNGSLVSILDPEENAFLITQLKHRKIPLWIGLHETGDNVYEWSDHHHYRYNNWHYQYPRPPTYPGAPLECINMLVERNKVGRWTELNCDSLGAYICKAPKDLTLPPHEPPMTNCTASFQQYGHACFQVIHLERDGEHTWGHAEQKCRPSSMETWPGGGGLATLLDVYENAFVQILLNDAVRFGRPGFNAKAWVGMREEHGHYQWHNRCPTHFANLDSMVGDENSTLCVEINFDGRWHAHNCTDRDIRFAVCERRFESCERFNHTRPHHVVCPQEFPHECADHCYRVSTITHHTNQTDDSWRVTFDEARANCRALGGDLVSIRNEAQQKCVRPYAQYSEVGLWIGLRNFYEGPEPLEDKWTWVDNDNNTEPALYTNWNFGEPNYGTSERCAEIYPDTGYWNNVRCDAGTRRGYICQADRSREVVVAGTVPPTWGSGDSDGLSGGAIAGIVIGVLLGVALVGGLGFAVATGRLSFSKRTLPSRGDNLSKAMSIHS